MSCYSTTVLTPRPFSDSDKAQVVSFVRALADEVVETSFHICGQPFDFEFALLDGEQAAIGIQGWSPMGALRLTTFCGSKVNHILLGVLSSRLARMFDGWIELDGAMKQVTDNPSVLSYDGTAGRIQIGSGADVISPGVMDYWLGHDDFKLV